MKLSEQCITLEQAKKLKELGLNKDSLAIYTTTRNQGWSPDGVELDIGFTEHQGETGKYPAYTVSELMDYLPTAVLAKPYEDSKTLTEYMLGVFKSYYTRGDNPGRFYQYTVQYSYEEDVLDDNEIDGTNLAQALGDMLIYLIENKYIQL